MSNLYSSLVSFAKTKHMPKAQQVLLSEQINSLDKKGKEYVLILICSHSVNSENKNIDINKLPYNNDSELNWSVSDLPNELKWILQQFVKMHTEQVKLRENQNKFI